MEYTIGMPVEIVSVEGIRLSDWSPDAPPGVYLHDPHPEYVGMTGVIVDDDPLTIQLEDGEIVLGAECWWTRR